MTPGQLVTYKGRKWSVVPSGAAQGYRSSAASVTTLVEQRPFWPFPGATIVVNSRDLKDNVKVNLNTLENALL